MKAHCLSCAQIARKEGFFNFANALVIWSMSFPDPLPIRPDNDREVLAQLNAKRSLKELHG